MDSFIENFTAKDWERFCANMIRKVYGRRNFYQVPDEDSGDLGIEFFTTDGTIFQCYFPDHKKDMKKYKQDIQKKIREDLGKLKNYEKEITELLDGIVIKEWVLLTPEDKSKDLISYCHKKKKETLAKGINFLDKNNFQVKIETADSFPQGKLYAANTHATAIDIPLKQVSDQEKEAWKKGNSQFDQNIERKSKVFMESNGGSFQKTVVEKYIQHDEFLDSLRDEHPDLYLLIEDSSIAQLEQMKEDALFESKNQEFIKNVIASNKAAFKKHAELFSDKNLQALSFGYLSRWIAECYMDFENDD